MKGAELPGPVPVMTAKKCTTVWETLGSLDLRCSGGQCQRMERLKGSHTMCKEARMQMGLFEAFYHSTPGLYTTPRSIGSFPIN